MRYGLAVMIVAGAVGTGSLGCQTPIKGHHESDPSANWGSYRTYAWVTEDPLIRPVAGVTGGDLRVSPLLEQHIRRAVELELGGLTYRKAEVPEAADLIVSFSLGARDKIQVDSYPVRAGYRYGGYAGYGGGYAQDVRTYTEGTLALDFFDRRRRQAVWHGWATKRLSTSRDQEQRIAIINEAVAAILEPFPRPS